MNKKYFFKNCAVSGLAEFTPLAIPNLIVWFDASTSANFVMNGNYVDTWYDLSANAKHVSQATVGIQPEYISGSGVYFDGTGDRLVNSSFSTMNGLQSFTMLVLGNIEPLRSEDSYFATLTGSSSTSHCWQAGTRAWQAAPAVSFNYNGTPAFSPAEVFSDGSTTGTTQTIIYRREYNIKYSAYVDGVETTPRTLNTSNAISSGVYLTLGASNYTGTLGRFQKGFTKQLLIYGRALNSMELGSLLAFLNTKR